LIVRISPPQKANPELNVEGKERVKPFGGQINIKCMGGFTGMNSTKGDSKKEGDENIKKSQKEVQPVRQSSSK